LGKPNRSADPETLGDGLLLLIEGTFVSGQLFGKGGPGRSLVEVAERLIDASVARAKKKSGRGTERT